MVALILAIGALAGPAANAAGPTTVGLGTAAAFAVLAGTPNVTNSGLSTITGDLGIHPAAAVTGFPPGIVNGTIHTADAVALQAKSDLTVAYLDAAGRPSTAVVAGGTLGGQTLVGGVYNAGGVTLDLTGTVTLDGQNDPSSVWIFQATSDLVTASSSTVAFINGAQPCNVFWQVTSSATLGSGSTFVGTILALTSIWMDSAVTLNGRALARNGQVTLINDTIAAPACAAAPAAAAAPAQAPAFCIDNVLTRSGTALGPCPPGAPMFSTTTPPPSVAPAVIPTAPPVAPPTAATPGPAATPVPGPVAPVAVRGVQTLPSTSTLDGTGPVAFVGLLLVLIGALILLASRGSTPTLR